MFFFFNDTATTEIYTLSLHDALPIYQSGVSGARRAAGAPGRFRMFGESWDDADGHRFGRHRVLHRGEDRKSTRLNSSHLVISYAVFCLKKKNGKVTLQQEGRNAR